MAGGEVQLVDLVKRFGDFTAVAGVNLEMPSGEFFSLLGPSGCGKTTSLRMIAGFERPTEGQILLDGVDMAQTPPHKRNVNTVFQNYALFPHLTVEENVAFGLKYQKASKEETRDRVGKALELVQMTQFAKRRPEPALGRAATARGAGPRPDPQPEGPAAGRAARRPGREAPQAVADRAESPAGRGRHHVHLRHARPGRGADDVRPHRGDVPGPRRAGRRPEGDLRVSRDGLRRGLPRRVEPDGCGGRGCRRRRLQDRARRVLADRRRGRRGHDRRLQDHDPPRTGGDRGAGHHGREPPARDGRAHGLRRARCCR